MDRTSFDGITKALASGQSRRTILRLLVGGIAAGTATAVVGKSVAAQGVCYESGPCPPYECCEGFACVAGECVAEEVEESPSDTTEDTSDEVALPETGVGGTNGDGSAKAGLVLAGGIAAWMASRYLRDSEQERSA